MREADLPKVNPTGALSVPGQAHPLIGLLEREYHIDPDSLDALDEPLERAGQDLAELKRVLVKAKAVSDEIFQQAVARLFGLEFDPHLDNAELLPEFTKAIPIRFAKKFNFFPTKMTEDTLWVAVENPQDFEAIDDVGRKLDRRVRQVVSTHQAILSLINRAYDRAEETTDEVIEGIDTGEGEGLTGRLGIEEPEDLIDARDEEPIKRLLNNVLYQAARNNASDVHIDATPIRRS